MASLADIKNEPKFFELKKNFHEENLCEICKQHKIIVAVKWGCDFIITTNLLAKTKRDLRAQDCLHLWCVTDKDKLEGKPPQCFREYKDAGYCKQSV